MPVLYQTAHLPSLPPGTVPIETTSHRATLCRSCFAAGMVRRHRLSILSWPARWPDGGHGRAATGIREILSSRGPERQVNQKIRWPRPRSDECEALVAVPDHGLAAFDIGREAADVGHEHARLAGDVGADVPRAAGGAERDARDLADMADPRLLSLA